MVHYLAFTKLAHWDGAMRTLTSQTLSVLCVFNPKLIIEEVLTPLVNEKCFSKILATRHGALLGVAEILVGLSGNSVENREQILTELYKTMSKKQTKLITESDNQAQFKEMYLQVATKNHLQEAMQSNAELFAKISGIVKELEQQKLLKGRGGELIRFGVCRLIQAMAWAKMPLADDILNEYTAFLMENMRHPNDEITVAACKSFQMFCHAYFEGSEEKDLSGHPLVLAIKGMYGPSQTDQSPATTKGYNQAFGMLSPSILKELCPELTQVVLSNCVARGQPADNVEARKEAVKSLVSIVYSLGIEQIDAGMRVQILDTIYTCLNDYFADNRGDVGSIVRAEAMQQLLRFINIVLASEDASVKESLGANTVEFFTRATEAYLG